MDIFKDIINSEYRDIVVSLPKDNTWIEYLSKFMELRKDGSCLNVIVANLPKTASGMKCFIVYDGFLRGYMEISKIRETSDNAICIELVPFLFSSSHKLPMSDIDNYKYFFDNSNTQ